MYKRQDRSIAADLGRNPHLINRLRNLFGLDGSSESVVREDKLHIGQAELDKMRSKWCVCVCVIIFNIAYNKCRFLCF